MPQVAELSAHAVAFLLSDEFECHAQCDGAVTARGEPMTGDPYANLRLAAWRDALRVLAMQFVALVLVAGVAALGWGAKVGLGALIGAAIGLLANAFFAVALLGKPLLTGKQSDVRLSWIIKVVLTLSLLWIAMRAKIVPPPSLVAGLTATMMAQWLAVSFWLGRR